MTEGKGFKLGIAVIYALIVGGAFIAASVFAPAPPPAPPPSKAAHDIEAGHPIVAGDLVPADQDKLVGRYAVGPIKKDSPIAAKDVSERKPNEVVQPQLTVTFTVSRASADGAPPDSVFQVCLAGKIVAEAKPLATSCTGLRCQITLPLNRGQDVGLADIQRATVIRGNEKCGP
ncbi:MAG TPA: hypothetical protein VMI56_13000 [Reyranella sp.]|nr:hypothetical protein [Reyranella sp.]